MLRTLSFSLCLALSVLACQDAPTAPADAASPEPAAPTGAFAGFADALEDLRNRILPAVGDDASVRSLATALSDLQAALAGPDTTLLTLARDRAELAAAAVQVDPYAAADFAVITLVLDQIAFALRGDPCADDAASCETQTPPEASDL